VEIAVVAESSEFRSDAEVLAEKLSCEFVPEFFAHKEWKPAYKSFSKKNPHMQAVVLLGSHGLSLLSLNEFNAMAPVYVDFDDASWQRRLSMLSAKKELSAKALGLASKENIKVFDGNAGLGQDLFVAAALGAEVHAVERSVLVFELLKDALQRASQIDYLQGVTAKIQLENRDALAMLKDKQIEGAKSIYLDPMFPEKQHQAKPKKGMQVFQSLIGVDEDAETLLELALSYLKQENPCTRVVLKRPRLAPVLFPERLGRQEKGNATRFDIYFASH
jgi:16S rRNA (guanine1516-N2)-methyltransferase